MLSMHYNVEAQKINGLYEEFKSGYVDKQEAINDAKDLMLNDKYERTRVIEFLETVVFTANRWEGNLKDSLDKF